MAKPRAHRSLVKRILRGSWLALCIATVGVLVLVIAGLLSLNLPIVRRKVVAQVDAALRSSFAGIIAIEQLNHLGLTGITGARVRIRDPEGVEVLLVEGVSMRISPFALAKSALFGKGDRRIDLDDVALDYVDVNLDMDTSGALRLARAFEARGATPSDPSARGTVIHLPHLSARHVWVHGQPKGSPLIDADLDGLKGSVRAGSAALAIDIDKIEVRTRAMPNGANLHANVEAHFSQPSQTGADQGVQAKLAGDIGQIPLKIVASMDGKKIDAVVDVPKFQAEKARALEPSAPIHQDVAAHVEAHGTLPALQIAAHAEIGNGTVDATSLLKLEEETSVRATVDAKHVDLRAFSPTSPASDLGATVIVEANSRPGGDAAGTYSVDAPAGNVGTNRIPAAHIEGGFRVESRPDTEIRASVTGKGAIDEPGARTEIAFDFHQQGDSSAAGFEVKTNVPRLDQTRVGSAAKGSLRAMAKGTIELGETSTIETDIEIEGWNLAHDDQRLQYATLVARAKGPLANPSLSAKFDGSILAAGGMQFASVGVTARGNTRGTDVTLALVPTDGPKVEGKAHVVLGDVTTIRDVNLSLAREDARAVISVAAIHVGGGKIGVEGAVVEGLGDPLHAELRSSQRELYVRAATNELDLTRVARLLRRSDLTGHLGIDVDLSLKRAEAHGHARLDLEGVSIERVKDASVHIDANVEGRQIAAVVHAWLGRVGHVDMDACELQLGEGDPLELSTWENAWGRLALEAEIDVARVRALLPRGSLPFDEMNGNFRLKGEVERASGEATPDIRLTAATKGLVLVGKAGREQVDGTRVLDTPPWRIEGMDIEFGTSIEGKTGRAGLTTRVFDRQGTLVSLDAHALAVPYQEWLRAKTVSVERLEGIPLTVEVDVPSRDFKKLPSILRAQGLGGDFGGSIKMHGTLLEPTVELSLETNRLESTHMQGVEPLHGKIEGRYENSQTKIQVEIGSAIATLLTGTVDAKGNLGDALQPKNGRPLAWQASTQMHLDRFPLQALTMLGDLRIKGRMSGDLAVLDLHKDARAKVQLTTENLEIGRVRFPRGNLQTTFDGEKLKTAIHFEQSDGLLDGRAEMGMSWRDDVVPSIRKEEAAVFELKANRFRAAALLPFVQGSFSELDGRIDADTRVDLGADSAKMAGHVTMTEGRFQLARLGEPFQDVTAKVVLTPDGVVRLDDVTAYGSTGKVMANGVAHLKGFQLVSARAAVRIPKNNPLPVDIDGVEIGDIDGDINISVDSSANQRETNVKIDIPRLHTLLPDSSTNKVQELGEAKEIRVGFQRRPTLFVRLPKDADDLKPPTVSEQAPSSMNVAIHLGNDIEIKKGTMLRIVLDGDPVLHVADKARMSGQIRLKRGTLEVQGKRFEIERGTVTFVGDDPANPQVVVTAGWTAPDGTRVYADFVGPLKTGNVMLRSQPARPQNEILALIMFGTAEGSSSTPYSSPKDSSTTTQAGVAAGGFATDGLSKGLDRLTGLEVSAKIDTSTSNPRPEVEVQIARDISLQIGYILGTPPPGTNPDKTLVTIDWRFKQKWSLEATVGNAGSSILDMVWQYRY